MKKTIAVKIQEKQDVITSLKHSYSEIVHEVKMERNILNKTEKAASKAARLKDQLAKDQLAKLKHSTTTEKNVTKRSRARVLAALKLRKS